jgi:hypothetical protein
VRYLRPDLGSNGYLGVNFNVGKRGSAKRVRRHVHALVALAFIGPRPSGQDVRHGEAGSLINEPSNLSYGTRRENIEDTFQAYRARGEKIWNCSLDEERVREIRRLADQGRTTRSLGKQFGVDHGQISKIINYRAWKHVK